MVMQIKNRYGITVLVAATLLSSTMAMASSPDYSGQSFYSLMDPPSLEEQASLQRFAMSHGFNVEGFLAEPPESDAEWGKFFSLAVTFTSFDANARFYGHAVYVTYFSYVSYLSADRYSELLSKQKPEVVQRIRDFLYLDAAGAKEPARTALERKYRSGLSKLFPPSYKFGEGDVLFNSNSLSQPKQAGERPTK